MISVLSNTSSTTTKKHKAVLARRVITTLAVTALAIAALLTWQYEHTNLSAAVRKQADAMGLTGDPSTGKRLKQTLPAENPEVQLGKVLFFSRTLSGAFDVACATCHLPDFGGSDGLSLSVGVAAINPSVIGPGRKIDPSIDLDPRADGGPNMHRNSMTIFNAALHEKAMLHDGRVFVLPSSKKRDGTPRIRTPETGSTGDRTGVDGLVEAMVKFPISNNNEMRGYQFPEIANPQHYRHRLVARLRGQADKNYLAEDAAKNWRALFSNAFDDPEPITLVNMQRALSAYISSQIFIETPWKDFLHGDDNALSQSALRGAQAFLLPLNKGGLGCASCHSGDFFTDEKFYNVGFPQIGRGFNRAERNDLGRWMATHGDDAMYSFIVPSLLNVTHTAPYGHSGTFNSLEEVIQYHANPDEEVNLFNFELSQLAQFSESDIAYPFAKEHTLQTLSATSFDKARKLLPQRTLSTNEIADLVEFLTALSDVCVEDAKCRNQWTASADEDPDGNLLIVNDDTDFFDGDIVAGAAKGKPVKSPYNHKQALVFPATKMLDRFADVVGCDNNFAQRRNKNMPKFVQRSRENHFGLSEAQHGFEYETWGIGAALFDVSPMIAGGISGNYFNDDCWPDLVFTGGEKSGVVVYQNLGAQQGFTASKPFARSPGTLFTGAASADLNGDYRRELVLANLFPGAVPVFSLDDNGMYQRAGNLPMGRNTFGIAFGDYDNDGYPDMFLSHWSQLGIPGTAPAFWKNGQGRELIPFEKTAHLGSRSIDQRFNFAAAFADFNQDGWQDLVVASDFDTSLVLQNTSSQKTTNPYNSTATRQYANNTQQEIISDENGMGSAVGDFDNDQKLDWFVTSVYEPSGKPMGNWGVSGNRLYRNVSDEKAIKFEDVTADAGVRDGAWGWAACFADFNNDGLLDIFHVNGFGHIPESIFTKDKDQSVRQIMNTITEKSFQKEAPRLFINQDGQHFTDQASQWGIDIPSEGRGITCFDYDRDGDIDIALVDHSNGVQFHENQIGHQGMHRFLSLRLVGAPPNTDALGARVTATATVSELLGKQTQTRISQANSNYNSQNPPDIHFGMGAANSATLRVTWPDTTQWQCEEIKTNQFIVLDQREIQGSGCQKITGTHVATREQ